MKEIKCNLDNIAAAAEEFLEAIGDNTIIAFYGHMGAGKTTFIKALCDRLGVADTVCSPTFTIVNEYCAESGHPVFHFDFYRINSLKEAVDIGLDEYFYSDELCLIEWPEKIEELLPEETLKVTIELVDETNRTITLCL